MDVLAAILRTEKNKEAVNVTMYQIQPLENKDRDQEAEIKEKNMSEHLHNNQIPDNI